MIAIRARLWALYYLVWVIVLFCCGVLIIQWALEIGLSHFLIVLPEWSIWVVLCLAVFRFSYVIAKHRSDCYKAGTAYVYNSSEPKLLGQIVEKLCLQRHSQLPHLIITNDKKLPICMINTNRRPNILILRQSLIEMLTPEQLRGVIAHELRHSGAIDKKIGYLLTIVSILFHYLWAIGGISYLLLNRSSLSDSLWAIAWIVGFAFVMLVVINLMLLSISRAIEYRTDILSSLDTGDPEALLSALIVMNPNFHSESYYSKGVRRGIPRAIIDWLSSIQYFHPTNGQRERVLNRVFRH